MLVYQRVPSLWDAPSMLFDPFRPLSFCFTCPPRLGETSWGRCLLLLYGCFWLLFEMKDFLVVFLGQDLELSMFCWHF